MLARGKLTRHSRVRCDSARSARRARYRAVVVSALVWAGCGASGGQVVVSVSGDGAVRSDPAGIDCSSAGGTRCSAALGEVVQLTALPSSNAHFDGWDGDAACHGGATLTLLVQAGATVTCHAHFAAGLVATGPGSFSGAGGGGGGVPGFTSILAGEREYRGSTPAPTPIVWQTKSGATVTQDVALSGWVSLYVDATAPTSDVDKSITNHGGTVIDSIPRAGLYTVLVPAGQEAAFLRAMFTQRFVLDGEPATVDVAAAMSDLEFIAAPGVTDCSLGHSTNVVAVMERGGQPVAQVSVPKLTAGCGTAQESAVRAAQVRALIKTAESGAKTPDRTVVNMSLQSCWSHLGDEQKIRSVCKANPSDAVCGFVAQAQLRFLLPFLNAVTQLDPKVRDNTMVVIASGNAGVDMSTQLTALQQQFPEAFRHIKVVGGTDASGAENENLNFSDTGMVFAPSVNVRTLPNQTCDGTSFAAPEVARVLDRLWRSQPTLSASELMQVFDNAVATCNPGGTADALPGAGGTTTAWLMCALALAKTAATPQPCNNQTTSGGLAAETHKIDLGKKSGTFAFSWDMFQVPDAMTVTYEGKTLLSTGCVSGAGMMSLPYSGSSTQVTVSVSPDCMGQGSTQWNFTVGCPP